VTAPKRFIREKASAREEKAKSVSRERGFKLERSKRRRYNGIEADPKLRAYCLSISRNRPSASEYKEQLFRREPLGRRVILINAKVEGSWSNEQKKGLNDAAEVRNSL
ncbi:hypothetical protein C5167_050833, partial [Papaver somniferum]